MWENKLEMFHRVWKFNFEKKKMAVDCLHSSIHWLTRIVINLGKFLMTFPIRCILTVKLAAELHAERSNHFNFFFPENFSNWPGHQRDEFQTFSTCQLLTRLHLSYNKQMIGRLRVCVCVGNDEKCLSGQSPSWSILTDNQIKISRWSIGNSSG